MTTMFNGALLSAMHTSAYANVSNITAGLLAILGIILFIEKATLEASDVEQQDKRAVALYAMLIHS